MVALSEAQSSPLSSPPSSSPERASPVRSSPPVQPAAPSIDAADHSSIRAASQESLVQVQQVPASESVSMIAPTSTMGYKRAPKQSPKRTREQEDDSDEAAFATPPPKRTTSGTSGTSATANKTTTTNKATSSLNGRAKKPTPKRAAANNSAPDTMLSASRPSRNRKAPERFEHFQEKPKPKAIPNKKGASKVFDPVFITTHSTSRLTKADIYESSTDLTLHLLLEGPAWTSLSAEQQSTLVSMLPQDAANQALLAKINAGETEGTRPSLFTMANDCFRTDVAKFQDDLKNGHLAKTWQAAAEQAVIERAAGEYDEWKAEEAESWWGQKSK
ncbi:hypothetical protein BDW02DRAFT_590769 [Decorospora gaudefroyi]|uniref:ASX DEUBAD domain-containing protein n=1 Tax=Decorospora gaudefroyi TaxID=184978 RepID=A0A6A5KC71_9PLEO|nr:hypothetical protein BDW02DRAFT_590769 [Decorospora gaudefroyi]